MYGKKLKELRKIEGWTQEQVAKKIGVSKQTYSHYENENRTPSLKTIRSLAGVYGVDLDHVFGDEIKEDNGVYEVKQFVKLPIVGQVACGNKELAFEDIEGYEEIPSSWVNGGEYFFLRAKGDSMIGANITNGDLLLIRKQEEIEDGEIAVVIVNDEATLKRVYKRDGTVILHSENSQYQPIVVSNGHVKIIGKLKRSISIY
jgi:repressor LexA